MRPRLEWLETFLAIVETGSLTRAGERVARSQSAVSLQLRRLEENIGARLFRRGTRHVVLTAAGERLVPLAHRAIDAAGAAGAVAGDQDHRLVRAGVPDEYAERLCPALLKLLTRRDPDLTFEVQCASSQVLERRIRGGRLDLAFVLAEEIKGEGEPVATDPIVWLQAPGAAFTGRRPLPVALFDHACSWRSRAIHALDAADIDYRIAFTSASVAGVRASIRAGLAVGVLAASTAGDDLEAVTGSDAPPALAPAELVLLRGDARDEDAKLFVDGARDYLKQ